MYQFGEWLRRERLEHGWSQVELAEKTYGEISQAAISAYERNRLLPSILDVQILATACEQTLGSIPWYEFDLSTEKKQNWMSFLLLSLLCLASNEENICSSSVSRIYRKTPFRTMSVSLMRRRFYYRRKFIRKPSKQMNDLQVSSGFLRKYTLK